MLATPGAAAALRALIRAEVDILTNNTINASKFVLEVLTLRNNQIKALLHLPDPTKPHNLLLLLVNRTGGSKTRVTRLAGIIKRGIILIIIPLLTLSADQIAKFLAGNERWHHRGAPHEQAV